MSGNPFERMLGGACRGDAMAIEQIGSHLAPAIMLEAQMQLRDQRLWQQEGGAMRRGILKRLLERVSQPSGPEWLDELGRLAVRLIENKARNYLHRRAAATV